MNVREGTAQVLRQTLIDFLEAKTPSCEILPTLNEIYQRSPPVASVDNVVDLAGLLYMHDVGIKPEQAVDIASRYLLAYSHFLDAQALEKKVPPEDITAIETNGQKIQDMLLLYRKQSELLAKVQGFSQQDLEKIARETKNAEDDYHRAQERLQDYRKRDDYKAIAKQLKANQEEQAGIERKHTHRYYKGISGLFAKWKLFLLKKCEEKLNANTVLQEYERIVSDTVQKQKTYEELKKKHSELQRLFEAKQTMLKARQDRKSAASRLRNQFAQIYEQLQRGEVKTESYVPSKVLAGLEKVIMTAAGLQALGALLKSTPPILPGKTIEAEIVRLPEEEERVWVYHLLMSSDIPDEKKFDLRDKIMNREAREDVIRELIAAGEKWPPEGTVRYV